MTTDRMTVFFPRRTLDFSAPDGVFEAPPSELLEVQITAPEGPERIANTASMLARSPVAPRIDWGAAREASDEEILAFHTPRHLERLKQADAEGVYFSRTTYLPKGGLEAVRLSAGAAIDAARAVMEGRTRLAHALARPPSHHAQPDAVDGYCFVNGTGLAVLHALSAGARRVAVVDWDVHHGNGTQEGFYDRDDVLTISIHMNHGSWGDEHPQTGEVDETGRGPGEGFNLNLPLPFGAGDRAYALVLERCVEPALRRFAPDLIVLANGQDANQFDPNGRQCVTMAGFHTLATRLRAVAGELTGGRIVATQEGGYNPAYAPFCAYGTVAGLLGLPLEVEEPLAFYPDDPAAAEAAVDALIARHPLL